MAGVCLSHTDICPRLKDFNTKITALQHLMLLVFHNYCRIYLYFCPHSHVHSAFTGNGLPQFVQNLPVFFCPHSHVHSVISCGIGLPQLLQNLPVFFCPHSHVQPDASSCCVAPEATPAAPFPRRIHSG